MHMTPRNRIRGKRGNELMDEARKRVKRMIAEMWIVKKAGC